MDHIKINRTIPQEVTSRKADTVTLLIFERTFLIMAPFPSPTSTWHSTAYASISPIRPAVSANGKVVVITGGGTGIGAGTARSFAEAGATRIALLGRREQPLLDTQADIARDFPSVDIFVAPTDITRRSEVDAAFANFIGSDKVNIVVSNAGSMGPSDSVEDAEEHSFLGAVQQTIQGSLFIAQAFLRHAAPNAVAINVSSSAAHLNFAPQFAAYSIAKAATVRLWDSVASAHPELSVFHTQPGVVDTDLNKEVGGAAAFGFEDQHRPGRYCLRRHGRGESGHGSRQSRAGNRR